MNDTNKDEISIVWHIDDVLVQRPSLTIEQAREVLAAVKNNHNACIGINWDEIDFWIEECFPEPLATSSDHNERGRS